MFFSLSENTVPLTTSRAEDDQQMKHQTNPVEQKESFYKNASTVNVESQDIFASPAHWKHDSESDYCVLNNCDSNSNNVIVKSDIGGPTYESNTPERQALKPPTVPVSKYKNKNYVAKQTASSNLSKVLIKLSSESKNDCASPKTDSFESKRIGIVKESLESSSEFGNAQVVVFERQTGPLLETQSKKDVPVITTKKTARSKARKPRLSSDGAVMRELDKNLLVEGLLHSIESKSNVRNTGQGSKVTDQDLASNTVGSTDVRSAGNNCPESSHAVVTTELSKISVTEQSRIIQEQSEILLQPIEGHNLDNSNSKYRKRRLSVLSDFSVQRRSYRIAEQSSQSNSQSQDSDITSPVSFSTKPRRKSGNLDISLSRKKRKSVLVTSMFQCLVDEGKRQNDNEEFSLPDEFLDICLRKSGHSLQNSPDVFEGSDDIEHCDKIKHKTTDDYLISESNTCDSVSLVECEENDGDFDKLAKNGGEIVARLTDTERTGENVSVGKPSITDQLQAVRLDTCDNKDQAYSISPSELTADRPGDQCVSANSSKVEVMSPLLFESQTDNQPMFTFNNQVTAENDADATLNDIDALDKTIHSDKEMDEHFELNSRSGEGKSITDIKVDVLLTKTGAADSVGSFIKETDEIKGDKMGVEFLDKEKHAQILEIDKVGFHVDGDEKNVCNLKQVATFKVIRILCGDN